MGLDSSQPESCRERPAHPARFRLVALEAQKAPSVGGTSCRQGGCYFSDGTRGRTGKLGPPGRSGARCLITDSPIDLWRYIRNKAGPADSCNQCLPLRTRTGSDVGYSVPSDVQLRAAAETPRVELPGIEMPPAALGFRVQQYGLSDFSQLFTPRQAFALSVFAEEIARFILKWQKRLTTVAWQMTGYRLKTEE